MNNWHNNVVREWKEKELTCQTLHYKLVNRSVSDGRSTVGFLTNLTVIGKRL